MASAPVNMLVTSGEQPAVVFRDILKNGLSDFLCLPESNKFDMPTCSLAIDIDFDGQNEVLVGTYGQELLAYKFFSTIEKLVPVSPYDLSDHSTPSPTGVPMGGEATLTPPNRVSTPTSSEKGPEATTIPENHPEELPKMELRTLPEPNYRLIWQRSFNYPLMGLQRAEMMGDGLENIAVLSLFGLHIMQPDMNELANLVTNRLHQLCISRSEDGDEFHKLQTE